MGTVELPTAEVLPGIGDHSVVYHNGDGYYYVCKDYLTSFDNRELQCLVPECPGQASVMQGGLVETGSHFHTNDLGYRDKCVLLHTIRQRFLQEDTSAILILKDVLESVTVEDDNIDIYTEDGDNAALDQHQANEDQDLQEQTSGSQPDEVFKEEPVEEVEVRSMDGEEEQIILERPVFKAVLKRGISQDRGGVFPSTRLKKKQLEPKSASPKKGRQESTPTLDSFVVDGTLGNEIEEPEIELETASYEDHQYYENDGVCVEAEYMDQDFDHISLEGAVLTPSSIKRMTQHTLRRRVIADKDGYIYSCNRNNGENMYLRCSQYSKGCNARAILRANGQIEVKTEYAHNHVPNHGRVASREFTALLLEQVRTEISQDLYRPLREVYNEMLIQYPAFAPYVTFAAIRRVVRRAKLMYC